jgi:beta-lactamase class A
VSLLVAVAWCRAGEGADRTPARAGVSGDAGAPNVERGSARVGSAPDAARTTVERGPHRADKSSNATAATDEASAAARAFLATIKPDRTLQRFLEESVDALERADAGLRRQTLHLAVIDLPREGAPRLAHWNGDAPVYPASVPKFVYLMATFAWRDQGRLVIDPELDRQLRAMVHVSSNQATQRVVARITGTEPGPRLPRDEYRVFRERRLAVKRWLATLGITDLHVVNPTYDGGGDLYGRDLQFLEDRTVPGALPKRDGALPNRQAMTANGTTRLLALLATDRALAPATSEEVRRRMQRDVRTQPYLRYRIAGGAERTPGLEVYAKTGTWGPIHADAGIVRQPSSGHQVVVAAFVEGTPRYRGAFIAELTDRIVRHLLGGKPG